MAATVIALPGRKPREGSVTDQQVEDVHAALTHKNFQKGQAVVVCQGIEAEATARNRARALGLKYTEKYGVVLKSHSVEDADGTFVGAVSVKPVQPTKPIETPDADADNGDENEPAA